MKKRNFKTLKLKKDLVSKFHKELLGGKAMRYPTDGCTRGNGCSYNCSIVEDCTFEKF